MIVRFIGVCAVITLLVSCHTSKHMNKTSAYNYEEFTSQQKHFASKDGNIAYVDKGAGQVILLVHGFPTSSWLYRKMITDLVGRGYRVIAPDMLGFGNSDNPKGYNIYNSKKQAERLLALMDHLNINTWCHVMHDAGGIWTWELIDQAPERISHLVMLNTIVYEEGFNPPIRMKQGALAKTSMWLYRNGITTNLMMNQLVKSALIEKSLSKEEKIGYKKPWLDGKTRAMYFFLSNTCNTFTDYSYVFEKINVPVAIVWGKEDNMLMIDPQLEKIKKNFSVDDKNIHLLNAKHFIQEEEPLTICKIIDHLMQ